MRALRAGFGLAVVGTALVQAGAGCSSDDVAQSSDAGAVVSDGASDSASSSPIRDGGVDVETKPSARPGCSAYPNATFCDDFESETDEVFARNWPSEGAPLLLKPAFPVDATAYSGTHVLRAAAELDGKDGSLESSVGVFANPDFGDFTKPFSLGFSMRVVSFTNPAGPPNEQIGPSPNVLLQVGSCLIQFTSHSLTQLVTQIYAPAKSALIDFTVGTWQRIEVDAVPTDAGTATVEATVLVDGKAVMNAPCTSNGLHKMWFESFVSPSTPKNVVDFDDIVVRR